VGEGRALRAVVRALKTGRSGLIAASLLSATTVIGCGDGTPGAEASEKDTVQVTDVVSDTAADIPAIPPYGIPPEDIRETEDAAMPMDTAPDIPAVPPYGIPPEDIQEPRDTEAPPKDITSDAGSSPDADDVADAKPQPDTAPDTVPVPPYGIPPEQD